MGAVRELTYLNYTFVQGAEKEWFRGLRTKCVLAPVMWIVNGMMEFE